jgi:hypothetical protein
VRDCHFGSARRAVIALANEPQGTGIKVKLDARVLLVQHNGTLPYGGQGAMEGRWTCTATFARSTITTEVPRDATLPFAATDEQLACEIRTPGTEARIP